MDDKDSSCCFSKEGTSVLLNPSAIARRKRMEILRFKKLSSTCLVGSDSSIAQISLHLKRARSSAANELCDALEQSEDIGTPSPKLQREEGGDCVQTKGKQVSATPKLWEDHRNDLPSAGITPAQMKQPLSQSGNPELQYTCSAAKEDVSTSQALSGDIALQCNSKGDSAILKVGSSSAQGKACTSCSSLLIQGYPPSGMLLLCGQRRQMLDRAIIVPCFANLTPDIAESCSCKGKEGDRSTNGLHFFAVYDGHGGSQASQFCMERLHLVLAEEFATLCIVQDVRQEFLPRDWKSVMASCFLRMDEEMGVFHWNGDCYDMVSSGPHFGQSITSKCIRTTAVVAVVTPHQIVVATCGDSRAVLSRGGKAIPLSLPHKQERDDAVKCLEAAVGQGYRNLKHFVVSEPEVMCIQRSEDDECLILASDGLWDVVDDPTTCEIAQKCLASTRSAQEFEMHDLGKDPASIAAAAILVKVAFGRGSKDNISVIVINLKT